MGSVHAQRPWWNDELRQSGHALMSCLFYPCYASAGGDSSYLQHSPPLSSLSGQPSATMQCPSNATAVFLSVYYSVAYCLLSSPRFFQELLLVCLVLRSLPTIWIQFPLLTRLMLSISSFTKHFAQLFIDLCFSLICGRPRVTICSILCILGEGGTWLTNVPAKHRVCTCMCKLKVPRVFLWPWDPQGWPRLCPQSELSELPRSCGCIQVAPWK